jgi:hypothetical protein
MPAIIKKPSKLRLEFVANTDSSVYGGLPAVEALCQQFGLWEKLRAIPCLDPRVRKGRGFGPEVIVAQLVYSFCSGGASLSDAEDLNKEPLARLLAHVPHLADQTTVGVAADAKPGHHCPDVASHPGVCALGDGPCRGRTLDLLPAFGTLLRRHPIGGTTALPPAKAIDSPGRRRCLPGTNSKAKKSSCSRKSCAEINANRMFYAIGALAYNLLVAVKLLHLPDDCQGWQVKTLFHKIMLMPERLAWWVQTMSRLWPQPRVGRPCG